MRSWTGGKFTSHLRSKLRIHQKQLTKRSKTTKRDKPCLISMRYKWHKYRPWTNYYFTSLVSLNLLELTEKPQQNGGKKRVSKEEKKLNVIKLLGPLCWNTGALQYSAFDSKTSTTASIRFSQLLSSARAWTSVILAGKRDSRRHSTTSFSENVALADRSFKVLKVLLFCGWEMA